MWRGREDGLWQEESHPETTRRVNISMASFWRKAKLAEVCANSILAFLRTGWPHCFKAFEAQRMVC